jgi:hypothetical protein
MVRALLAAATLIGCGPDCASMCEDGKKCEGADKSGDCEKSCETAEKAAESAGCESQYEAMLDCKDEHQDDMCTVESTCKKELDALASCQAK